MNLKEIGINTRNWIDLAQDRDYWRALENAALNLLVPTAMKLVYYYYYYYSPTKSIVLGPGGSMPHSQGLSNNPYPEPNQLNSLYCYLFI